MRRRSEIERIAAETRIRTGQTQYPIDPIVVAERLGVSVESHELSVELSGVLMRKGQSAKIAVNSRDGANRRRFTVAHELGHFVLEHEGELFVDKHMVNRRDSTSGLAINDAEIEANQFAASLLMPRDLVVVQLNDLLAHGLDRDDLVELMAGAFKVSRPAMEYRLVNLGLLSAPSE